MNALKKVKTKYANFNSINLFTVHLLYMYTVWDFLKICIKKNGTLHPLPLPPPTNPLSRYST